jgi:dihydrofolate synthase/folylpolyglutamate synthase
MAYENRKLFLIFGAMRDKAIHDIAAILFPLAEKVVATQIENPRAATVEEIVQAAPGSTEIEGAENVQAALERVRQLAQPGDVAVITGSIYIVGEAMRLLGARI